MARLTITEAIKQSPIGKTHFYKKYIDTGSITVSVDNSGKKYIDSSELLRVFGELRDISTKSVREQSVIDTNKDDSELIRTLREQIRDLQNDKEFYQAQITSLTNRLDAPKKKENWLVRFWNAKD